MRYRSCLPLIALLLALIPQAAEAGKIYQAIELGPLYYPSFTSDADGNRLVLDASGRTAYAFPEAENLLDGMSPSEIRSLPDRMTEVWWADRYEGTYENDYWYSSIAPRFLNRNGTVVYHNERGRHGWLSHKLDVMYSRSSDGRSGAFSNWGTGRDSNGATGLNSRDEIAGFGPMGPFLFDIDENEMHHLWSLELLGEWTSDGSHWDFGSVPPFFLLDDEGRMLIPATLYENGSGWSSGNPVRSTTLLLVPEGVSSESMPIPEPGPIAVLALAGSALVFRRLRSRAAGTS